LEALGGIHIRLERVMSSSAVHPHAAHLQTRGAARPGFIKALSAIVAFFRVLPEVFTEAKEMMRDAERRYPFVSFDS
jgi:hypothetical protein